MADQVICRSNHDYIGHPIAFYWQEQRLEVTELLWQNHTPHGYEFRVRNEAFGIFELDYDQHADEWSIHQL